jgi:ABC-type multidrug transport system ATPase subunit
MSEPAIEVNELTYSYGDHLAVDGLQFKVQPGEILGFLGPNGAGKSTTIKMLTGQIKPRSGSAKVLGFDVVTQRSKMQYRIGVCFEEKNLYLDMTARRNLTFFASLFGIRRFDCEPLLRRVGLLDRADDRVEQYSKGMRQRLMLARALVNNPDVLFLDEPTAGLDPVSSQAIRVLIRKEAERGAAVLLTTHDMAEADGLSDRVAFVNEGRLYALDTPENLKLAHGKRSARLQMREGDEIVEQIVPLDEEGSGAQLAKAVGSDSLVSIHTQEGTLESIFIAMTGRGLAE